MDHLEKARKWLKDHSGGLVQGDISDVIPRGNGHPVKIQSKLLGDKMVWICNSTVEMDALILSGDKEACYLSEEIARMKDYSKEHIVAVQMIKEIFEGSVVQERGK
jgi:hypothetical protein